MKYKLKPGHSSLPSLIGRALRVVMPALMLGGVLAAPVQAGQFGLRVLDTGGVPVEGASVCFGLPGNYRQFGVAFTDRDGMATMDVPNVPLIVTVSKTRFSGTRLSEPARGFNLVKDVVLQEGVPGPRCRAGSSIADAESSIKVEHVDVIEANDAIRLSLDVSGNPSHYRVSGSDAFDDASWLAFDNRIELPRNLSGQGLIFLQMRRYEGNEQAWLEARSSVVQVLLP